MSVERPIEWVKNSRARELQAVSSSAEVIPLDVTRHVRQFHQQIPGYRMSPLKSLPRLAERIGVGGIWVKDESVRLDLRSFKVLGGSLREQLGDIVFAAATDGNHGRGVAWSAAQMGFKSIIYVHKLTSRSRIQAIEGVGAKVVVVDGNYDDAVRQVYQDAQQHGWQVVSDTAWEGYEEIPQWVMQGYTTMLSEAQEQLAGQGLSKPTHVLVQAGVVSLAAATIGFYYNLFGAERPWSVVVEPTKAACLYRSALIGDGKPYNVEGSLDTIMAGLACGDPNPIAWKILYDCADVFAACPDYVAAKGMRVYSVPLRGDPFLISGESGAVTLGALMYIMEYAGARRLREALHLDRDSQVLLINSEGNTSPDDFRSVVWEGSLPVPEQYKIYVAD